MRRWMVLAALAIAGVVAVLAWAIRAERKHEERGPQQEVYNSFGPIEVKGKMPKTQVPGLNLSYSFTFKQAIWPGMGDAGGYHLGVFSVGGSVATFNFDGMYDVPSHPGQWGLHVGVTAMENVDFWYDTPASEDDVYWIEVPCSLQLTGNSATRLTSGEQIIGEKANATHSKEKTLTEEWFVPAGTDYVLTIGGTIFNKTTTEDLVVGLTIGIAGNDIDTRDWVQGGRDIGKYVFSIENIAFGAVEIDTSTYTARTWVDSGPAAGKVWVEGFGGNSIGFWASEWFDHAPFTYDDYAGGAISAPLKYSFALEAPRMDGVLVGDLKVWCSGVRNINLVSHEDQGPTCHTVDEWNALTLTQTRGNNYWDSDPPDLIPTVYFWTDLADARQHQLAGFDSAITDPSTLSFAHDGRWPIKGWCLDHTSRTESPVISNGVTLAHRDGETIYGQAHTHASWVGTNTTNPNTNGNFTVSAAGGYLTLTLANNYEARQAAVPGGGGATPIPDAYMYRRRDIYYPTEAREASYDMRGFGYLYWPFNAPADATVTLTLTYYDEETFGDDHMTGGERQTNYTHSAGALKTFTTTAQVRAGAGQTACFSLAGACLALVKTMSPAYSAAGDWRLAGEPLLCLDRGDTYPTPPRVAATPHFAYKTFETYGYRESGVAAMVDGIPERPLWCPDNYLANTVERSVGYIDYLVGRVSGIDQSACYSAAQMASRITNSGNAWVATHHAAAVEAHLKDADGTWLKSDFNAYDFCPHNPTAPEANYSLGMEQAVMCGQFTAIPGLPYKWHSTQVLDGQINGRATTGTNGRARGAVRFTKAWRRIGTDAFAVADDSISSDAHGTFLTDGMSVVRYGDDNDGDVYDYALGAAITSLGNTVRLVTREWTTQAAPAGNLAQPDICAHPMIGTTHFVGQHQGNILYTSSDDDLRSWRYGNKVAVDGAPQFSRVFDEADHEYPTICLLPSGMLLAGARRISTQLANVKRSYDMGETWEGGPVIGTDLSLITLVTDAHGVVHCAGYLDGAVYYERSDDGGSTLAAFGDGSTRKTVGASNEARPALVVLPSGMVDVTLTNSNGCPVMASQDGGDSWQGIDTLTA